MAAAPALIPVTAPDEVMAAIVLLLLAHVPPEVVLLNAVVEPSQMVAAPVMDAGSALTVMVLMVRQPDGSV